MENKFSGTDTLGNIVTEFPGASNLFKEARIDFCCGGDRELSSVLKEHQLNEQPFVDQLNQTYEQSKQANDASVNWANTASEALIDHTVNKYHADLAKELPAISEYVTKILRVHGMNHTELAKLHTLFHTLKMEFEQHLIDEEVNVFPLIKQYSVQPTAALKAQIAQEITILEADHSSVGDLLKEMRTLTDDYALPIDACNTFALTYRKLENLEADTFEHVHLENNILFPRFS